VAANEAAETYSLAASGEPGFERELLESFARGRGLRVEAVVSKTYPDRITMLVADKGDVIAAIFDTEDRRKLVNFTQEVMPTHNVAVTLRPAPVVAHEYLIGVRRSAVWSRLVVKYFGDEALHVLGRKQP
jgi:ABC-type amino acid transport substrate-binding protein